MALGVYGSDLVAGGFFTSAGGSPAVHIAKWNGSTWSPLGAGISGIVYGLTAWNGNLVAGGLFYNAGGQPAHDIARWDGTSWFPFGSGIGATGYEYVFAVTPYNGDLIAGGIFTTAGGLPAYGAARWDGFKWSPLGSGFWNGGSVAGAYTLTPYGNDVVAGGIFTSAGGMGVGHIARWNEPFVAYGPACPGNGGALPVLSGVGWPGPGSVAGVALTGGRPSGSGLLLLGTGPGSASVLGCTFLLSGLLFGPIGVALDASGAFSFTWALPPGGATGTQAFFQFVGIDPGAPNGMFSASNGLKVTLQ
jgi:hypothetical protein